MTIIEHRAEDADAESGTSGARSGTRSGTETKRSGPARDDAGGGRGRGRWYAGLALLVALAVLASGLWSWRSAITDVDGARAEARADVLAAATDHIETLNTLDHREIDAGLASWREVTTGTLRDQLTQVSKEQRALLADQRTVSEGKVVDAAVFSLDDDLATVTAAVEVTITDDTEAEEAPAVRRHRFSANLVKVDGEWLLETLDQVAVSTE